MQLDKSCEEQNIHADDIRGNFEMTTNKEESLKVFLKIDQ